MLVLGSNSTLREAIVAGLCVSVLTRDAVARELADGTVVEIPTPMTPLRRFWRLTSRDRQLPRTAELFARHLLADGDFGTPATLRRASHRPPPPSKSIPGPVEVRIGGVTGNSTRHCPSSNAPSNGCVPGSVRSTSSRPRSARWRSSRVLPPAARANASHQHGPRRSARHAYAGSALAIRSCRHLFHSSIAVSWHDLEYSGTQAPPCGRVGRCLRHVGVDHDVAVVDLQQIPRGRGGGLQD